MKGHLLLFEPFPLSAKKYYSVSLSNQKVFVFSGVRLMTEKVCVCVCVFVPSNSKVRDEMLIA